jgi:hypothetical protein
MATYSDLEVNSYYLIQEGDDEDIILVQPLMETNECVLLLQHDDYENTYWRRKDDTVAEIIEELTEEQVEEYENLFEDEDEDEDEWQ